MNIFRKKAEHCCPACCKKKNIILFVLVQDTHCRIENRCII